MSAPIFRSTCLPASTPLLPPAPRLIGTLSLTDVKEVRCSILQHTKLRGAKVNTKGVYFRSERNQVPQQVKKRSRVYPNRLILLERRKHTYTLESFPGVWGGGPRRTVSVHSFGCPIKQYSRETPGINPKEVLQCQQHRTRYRHRCWPVKEIGQPTVSASGKASKPKLLCQFIGCKAREEAANP